MEKKLINFLSIFLGVLGTIIVTPLVIIYYLILLFWKVYGTAILGFVLVGFFGGTIEECFQYGASVGFLIGIYLKYRELNK